ncbi:class I poly(R)-hydroxyalkanoic acid synthase [Hydrogenophilus thermoluteolus]|jgi:polyhydroxyalkanoate synthase|uniref:PHA/PHB synthase family protein n=1 Tax=Hydrogenophilus thermoluteolus TaxID=297 RepID=UPI001C63BA16|nr:class I poly(R)-hydroxyalkanoic acid synthase [Hydrogenophilus thermoluteolus]MBW7657585.1 class I poly(R)-hydroxyalkanoic acid synthase [Hydrogenophilus thermoluteolus]GLW60676.1 class I poly(R)-hydroxyalkanoic acid synthase [Hydrogenophilus thermoluteolus]
MSEKRTATHDTEKSTPYAQLPDPQELAKVYAEVAERAAKVLAEYTKNQLKKGITPPSDELGIAQTYMQMMARLLANPYKLAQAQMNLMWDYFNLWQHSMLKMMGIHTPPVAQPEKGDKRFKAKEWEEHFLFDFIKQSYLIAARRIHETVCCLDGIDETTQKKINFFTRNFIEALSPTNFALTNPEVFQETLRTNGQNLINGLKNLLRDLEEGGGQLRIRMTDTEAFELGKNIATTPGKVIFQTELAQLIQYTPTTKEVYKRPLLIVPPWINKYYILDLREKNSLVKWLVDQGHTVFILSWVNPDARLAQKTFADYVTEGVLAALDAIEEQTDERVVNAAGYCLGGTLLATTAAYLAAKRQKRFAATTFFTTLTDFSEPGELGVFTTPETVAELERKMAERGYLEGTEMASTFNMMRANDLIWSFVVNNYLLGREPFPFDLLYWNSDSTRMPAAMHSFYLRKMYLENKLVEPNGIEIDGVGIDLGKIKHPCYFISTVEDHIAPWKTTYKGARHFTGADVTFVLGGSGHIAGIVNPPAANKYGYWTNPVKPLPEDPEEWLQGATHHPGSWWPHWHAWLAQRNGDEKVPARDPAKGKLPVIEDAPGSYVTVRI